MTTPAPASTAPSGPQQSDPGNQPSGQSPAAPAPGTTTPPASPTPPAAPESPTAPAPATEPATTPPAPAEQPQLPAAPVVEGDISRLPKWAQRAITDSTTRRRPERKGEGRTPFRCAALPLACAVVSGVRLRPCPRRLRRR